MKFEQKVFLGREGAETFIYDFLSQQKQGSAVFLVAGKQSFSLSGAGDIIGAMLSKSKVTQFSRFSPSPGVGDIKNALVEFQNSSAGVIIAVGGGSAMDVAKLVRYFAASGETPEDYLAGERKNLEQPLPMLAVPTTAGSGSEATHFAVLYDESIRKHSIAHPLLIPTHVWLNPDFTASMDPYQTACCGFDAFAQAIESYWAVGSTEESRQDSAKALQLCLRHLEAAVLAPTSEHRTGMLQAAYLAGRAINVAKTTAAHALSYILTGRYGLPHGHAVALTLPTVFEVNTATTEQNVNDPRGIEHVGAVMRDLCTLLNTCSSTEAVLLIRKLMSRTGLTEVWFSTHGFDPVKVRDQVMSAVNTERLKNNPRSLDSETLAKIVSSIK